MEEEGRVFFFFLGQRKNPTNQRDRKGKKKTHFFTYLLFSLVSSHLAFSFRDREFDEGFRIVVEAMLLAQGRGVPASCCRRSSGIVVVVVIVVVGRRRVGRVDFG